MLRLFIVKVSVLGYFPLDLSIKYIDKSIHINEF